MIKEFSVGCSKTVNLGNFNSVRVEASIVWALDEDKRGPDDVHQAKQLALHQLKLLLEDNYKVQRKQGDHDTGA